MRKKTYIDLEELEIYRLSREMSRIAWSVYDDMDRDQRWTMGNQFVSSTDSIGANIAEGYGRYHVLDQIKFYHNTRGSLFEAHRHWAPLIRERNIGDHAEALERYDELGKTLTVKLNRFIAATRRAARNKK